MKSYNSVSRKTINQDRIAICPKFGCTNLTRVKPLKFGFLGFGKYPRCKKHHLPLVYVDERIGDIVDGTLSCLFDYSGLPPSELLSNVRNQIPGEIESFIRNWIFSITTGRGAQVISKYMDSISNSYMNELTKEQLKYLNEKVKSRKTEAFKNINAGIKEITKQYTRLIKHLRIHYEVFNNLKELKPLSSQMKKILSDWLNKSMLMEKEILSTTKTQLIPISETKKYYDMILNQGTCMCLLGFSTKKRENFTKKISAFDRFNAYLDFYLNGLTNKFSKLDISKLLSEFTNTNKKAFKYIYSFGRTLSVNIPGSKIITLTEPEDIEKYNTKFIDSEILTKFGPLPNENSHNLNVWFTDCLLNIMQQYEFLRDYASLRKMSSLFGLSKSYLYDKRYKKSTISHEYLDIMRNSITKYLEKIIINYEGSRNKAKQALDQFISLIEIYRQNFDPKLTANTQIDERLKINYFKRISTIHQAYYLGLMFADGWFTIQKSSGGTSSSYRICISLKVEDKAVLERFSEVIGLDALRVLERDSIDHRTGKSYRMSYLQFGAGSTSLKDSMAKDLIKHGITYKKNSKGKRIKIPILPVFCDQDGNVKQNLMLAFLLGYFDGDGTLKSNNGAEIFSSNYQFFSAIRKVFNLGEIYESKRMIYDHNSQTHSERSLYSLYLNREMMKKMMSLDLNSMERKAIDANSIDIDAPIMTKQRLWLKKVLPANILREILVTHSPNKMAILIGIDHNTLTKFISQIYNLKIRDKGYYISLSYKRKKSSSNDDFIRIYNERTQYLKEIGRKNPFKT